MKKSDFAVGRCKTISTIQKLLGGKYKIQTVYKAPSTLSAMLRQAQSLAVAPLPRIWGFLYSLKFGFLYKLKN